MAKKMRLDEYLVSHAMAEDITQARAYIMAGLVYNKEQKCLTAGEQVAIDDRIEIRDKSLKYVSRGGLKLEKAMNSFAIDLKDKVCMDIGASTGGFSDCMLQNGAKKVYCVDVGYGQLSWKLRSDERIVNMERTNIRFVTPDDLDESLDFASCDVSFISLKLIFPVAKKLLTAGGEMAVLIKPQFEASKEDVGEHGVVRDKDVHISVIRDICDFAVSEGFGLLGLTYSPIKGPEGNIEYLLYLKNNSQQSVITDELILHTVDSAHENAGRR